jgi:gliding motility-associated-like protein
VTDGCETPAVTGLVEVTINPLPVVVFTADILVGCQPLAVNFEELFSSNLGSCSWDFGDFTTSTACNTVTHEYNTSGCFDVSLTYTDNLNCVVTQSYANYVCVNENPVADFMFSPQEPSLLLEPNVSFTSSSISADQYLWELGDSNTTYSFTTENFDYSFSNYNPGDYPICLTVYTTEGCVDSLCQTITVTDDFLFYIPNSFTPGGDGRNDSFGPIMRGVTENYTFNVYDRWGEMVFKSDATTPMWAGDFNNNGELCPMGVYVWKIELFDDVNRIPKEFIGNVTLIR